MSTLTALLQEASTKLRTRSDELESVRESAARSHAEAISKTQMVSELSQDVKRLEGELWESEQYRKLLRADVVAHKRWEDALTRSSGDALAEAEALLRRTDGEPHTAGGCDGGCELCGSSSSEAIRLVAELDAADVRVDTANRRLKDYTTLSAQFEVG